MSPLQLQTSTESISSRFDNFESWPIRIALAELWESQRESVEAVKPALPAIQAAVEAATIRLRGGAGRLIYVGAGTSGRIGVQDGAELPPTFGWPQSRLVLLMAGGDAAFTQAIENAEDDIAAAAREIASHAVGPDDVAVGIAASGSTPYTLSALQTARAAGACTVAVANAGGGAILSAAEFPILAETGAEPIAGSTRLKAGTAQKVVLNLFSTMLMVGLGHVYRGLMVDMQAKNEKLRRRARRMLAHLTGAAPAEIEAALDAAGGQVKPAVLMLLRGCDFATAQRKLAQHAGHLRAALESENA